MNHARRFYPCLLLLIAVLGGCSRSPANSKTTDVFIEISTLVYQCDDDKRLTVTYQKLSRNEARTVTIGRDGSQERMNLKETLPDEFANGELIWVRQGNEAYLNSKGQKQLNHCKVT